MPRRRYLLQNIFQKLPSFLLRPEVARFYKLFAVSWLTHINEQRVFNSESPRVKWTVFLQTVLKRGEFKVTCHTIKLIGLRIVVISILIYIRMCYFLLNVDINTAYCFQ